MALKDCLSKNRFLRDSEKTYIVDRAKFHQSQGLPVDQAEIQAVEDAISITNKMIQEAQNQKQSTPTDISPDAPPPPTTPPSAPEGSDMIDFNARQTIEKLQEESNLDEKLKDAITPLLDYEVKPQERTQKKARQTIDRLGEDEAFRRALSFEWGQSIEEKLAILAELADRYNRQFIKAAQEGDTKTEKQAYDKFMAATTALAERITDTAQALAYMGLVNQMFETRVGATKFAKRQIEDSREKGLRNYQALKEQAEQLIREKEALEAEIQWKVEEKVQQTVEDRLKRAKLITKEQRTKIADAFDRLLIKTDKNIMTASVIPGLTLLPDVWNGSVKAMKHAVLTGADIANAVQAGIAYIKQHSKDAFDEQKFRDFFNPFVSDLITKRKEKNSKLVDKYVPKTDKPKVQKQKKEFYDKVIELHDAGVLTEQAMDDKLAQIFGLPSMTPEIVKRIGELVDNIQKAPDGRFRNNEITKLTDYIGSQQKNSWTDFILAYYRAALFSGISTQVLNNTGNIFSLAEMTFLLGFLSRGGKGIKFAQAAGSRESIDRAAKEAWQLLKTGLDPRSPGDMKRRILEFYPRSFWGLGKPLKGAKQALDPSLAQQMKYVFRAMSAGDMFFGSMISEGVQDHLLQAEAKKKGLKGREAQKWVDEQMGYTPENIAKASEQATKEAEQGMIPDEHASKILRVYEIIEQQRDPGVVQKAKLMASQQVMTNAPTGYIGAIAKNVNNTIRDIPALSVFIPVINFAANAMSRAIQYHPYAFTSRAIVYGLKEWSQGVKPGTQLKELQQRLKDGDPELELRLRRAAVGAITMGIMMALLSDDEDDENLMSKIAGTKIKVHGSGPGSTWSRQKTYELMNSGWKPWSIQIGKTYIPYQNYPALNVLLASMGEYNDAVRYGKMSKQDAAKRMLYAVGSSFGVITEMGFLKGIADLTSALYEDSAQAMAKSVLDLFTKPVTNTLSPRIHREVLNLFDNKIYSGDDIAAMALRSVPILNLATTEPIINELGEPVERNFYDRVKVWSSDTYSQYGPIWKANADKQYFLGKLSKQDLSKLFGRDISDKEFNQFIKYRGEEIVDRWDSQWSKLSREDYKWEMDKLRDFAKLKALTRMGVNIGLRFPDIDYALRHLNRIQQENQKIRQEIFR